MKAENQQNQYSPLFIGIALFALCGLFSLKSIKAQDKSNEPLNVIFILADDYRHDDFSFMEPSRATTPNLDKLAAKGIVFNNAYVTTSICAVSRASILTGMYARRHGIYGFRKNIPDDLWEVTYPKMFKKNGFRTGFIGKYGVNIWVPADQRNHPVEDFDYWFVPGPGQKRFLKDEKGRDVHYTRMLQMKTVEFLNDFKDEPFCLSISFLAAHGSLDPNPIYADMFLDETVPVPENYGDEYFNRLPEVFHRGDIFGRDNSIEKLTKYDEMQAFHRERKNRIYGLDMAVGRIIHELEALGLEDNTVIIFSGDNGYYTGEHGLNGKWWMHEESVRVPMIAYDPRLPDNMEGRQTDEIVLNIDIGPTLMDYVGITPDEKVQGRSFKRLVDGEKVPGWRTEFYYEQHFDLSTTNSKLYIPAVEGVINQRYKYSNYFNDQGNEELYDWREDPYEKNNLADEPEYQQVLEMMKEKYEKMKEELK